MIGSDDELNEDVEPLDLDEIDPEVLVDLMIDLLEEDEDEGVEDVNGDDDASDLDASDDGTTPA